MAAPSDPPPLPPGPRDRLPANLAKYCPDPAVVKQRTRLWVATCLAFLSHWLARFGNACARNWKALDRAGRLMVACLGVVTLCFALLAIAGWSRKSGDHARTIGAEDSVGSPRRGWRGNQSNDSTPPKEEADDPNTPLPTTELTPYRLFAEYSENELAADKKYKNKEIVLRGNFEKIDRAPDGRYRLCYGIVAVSAVEPWQYATMSARERKWFNEGYPPNVLVCVAKGHEQSFSTVKAFTPVLVRARVVGVRRDPDVFGGFVVELERAKFVEMVPAPNR